MCQDCIFCKIVAKEIPADLIYEDEYMAAFPDIKPQAPVHLLVIPKKHIKSLMETTPEDRQIIGHILCKIPILAKKTGVAEQGFRLVVNTRDNGGQTVPHLHWHILGGRFMTWPPG